MATINYGTGTSNVSINDRWINIRITVAGAQGGNGGNDTAPGGTRGPGRKGTFSLPDSTPRTLTLLVGSQGGNGFGCVSNSGAGGGGSSPVASGGGGGRTGPQGCSGGGGGGGGATGVYDSIAGTYIILAGGGGGAGGGSHPDSWLRGGNGGSAGGWSTSPGSISNGGTGRSQGYDGGGGGGGGGGASGGGGGREGADDRAGRYPSGGGGGGGSFYRTGYTTYVSGNGSNYANGYVSITYDLATPEITSFAASDSAIILGENVTFSWTTTYQQFINSIRLESPDGSIYNLSSTTTQLTVQPQQTGNWTLTLYFSGGTDTATFSHTVYIPPEITLTLDDDAIPRGSGTVLRWSTTGDATTMNITPGIGSTNLTSFSNVSPTVTTTYTAVAEGLGGQDTEEITLTVWQPPEVSISGPLTVNYADSFITLSHSEVNSDVSYQLEVIATDLDGVVTNETFDLDRSTSTYAYAPTWTNRGPSNFNFNLKGVGLGNLQDTDSISIYPYIDQMPDAVDIPESEDTFKNEEPIVTPDVEITTEQIVIDNIDIPVEIRADYPIQVEIDNDGNFVDVRQL